MISEECKSYEKFAITAWQDDPFPMGKNKLLRYIKFRARCSTFANFMSNLDKHPLHGIEWLKEMNQDSEVKNLMQFSVNLWPRQSKQCRKPLIGIGYVDRSFMSNLPALARQDEKKVRVVQGPKAKGFMVTDDKLENALSSITGANSVVINTTSQLSSNELYLPSKNRTTERVIGTNDRHDEDELKIIDGKQFHGVDIDSFEEGSVSSISSKKNSKEDEYDFDLNDFDVDLETDFNQDISSLLDLKSVEGMGDIDFVSNMVTLEEKKNVNEQEGDKKSDKESDKDSDKESDKEEMHEIREPVILIKLRKRKRGRPRTKPIIPPSLKRPVGRPRKPIPEPRIVIKCRGRRKK